MAFPTDTFTAADLAVFIPEVWGQRINDFYRANLVCANFFVDRSEEVSGGGDVLYTPNMTELSSNAKTYATAVTLNSPTEGRVTLTIDQHRECSFSIEDKEAAQAMHSYTIMSSYAENSAYVIAKDLDAALTALFAGFSQSVGSTGTNVADSDIRAAIALIEAADVPQSNRAFFFHPTVFWNQLQAIDKFSLAVNSPVQDPVAKRPDAHLYGIPVFTTTQIENVSGSTGRRNCLAHKDALHWAASPLGAGGSKGQMVGSDGIRVQANYIPEYLSTVVTSDILYGVIENRDLSGVLILSPA